MAAADGRIISDAEENMFRKVCNTTGSMLVVHNYSTAIVMKRKMERRTHDGDRNPFLSP